MTTEREIQVLVVRSWLLSLVTIRAALLEADLHTRIRRVDFEPALNAALTMTHFDVVIYDRQTPELSYDTLVECLRANHCEVPIVELGEPSTLGQRVAAALATRRS